MKRYLHLMAVLFVSCGFSYGQGPNVLLEDDFNDGTLDNAIWSTTGGGSVAERDGVVTTAGRKVVYTNSKFSEPVEIQARVKLNSGLEHFAIVLRSDMKGLGFGARTGVVVYLANDGNDISIQEYDEGGHRGNLVVKNYNLETNQYYNLIIRDFGDSVELWINGTLEISADTSFKAGEIIGFHSREFSSTSSSVDSFSIQQLPSPTKYQVIEGNFTWQEAKADAEAKGGRLAVLDTQEKIDAADSYLQEYYGEENFRVHIGLTDELVEGEYRWITGELLTASKWAGQEFLPTPGEDYISWYRTSFSQYGWFDHSNSAKEQYLLEILDETPPTAEFQFIEGNFTWQEARADAEAKDGRLAVLDTQEKQIKAEELASGLSGGKSYHIGLVDDEGWKWLSGEELSYTNWGRGEPSNEEEEVGTFTTGGWGTLQFGDWNDDRKRSRFGYLLEILDEAPPTQPAVPFVAIAPLYESPTGESITLDATPTIGFPTEFTYQWCFNGFKIPANLGGTASSINIDNLQANEGTWSVSITNSEGIFEQDFEYRLYADSDSDGLSDGAEEVISKTDINNPDTDNDGLVDGDEVNTYSTNPNSTDSDSDGFTDLYELETAYDPNSAESVPDALVNIITAIEVKFNAAIGATYAIEFSTDNQNWDVIEDDIVGEGGAVERLYSKQNFPTGFFRVERRDQ